MGWFLPTPPAFPPRRAGKTGWAPAARGIQQGGPASASRLRVSGPGEPRRGACQWVRNLLLQSTSTIADLLLDR
jgi:hypothetical protein